MVGVAIAQVCLFYLHGAAVTIVFLLFNCL